MSLSLEDQLALYVRHHAGDGILLDTNVLLLLLIAQFKPDLVGARRLEKYSLADAELLMAYVSRFKRIFTTPHVLTETSNLAAQIVKGQLRTQFFSALYPLFCGQGESAFVHCTALDGEIKPSVFVPLGLTDAWLSAVSASGRLLLTDDLDLYRSTLSEGANVINFTHMREVAGLL